MSIFDRYDEEYKGLSQQITSSLSSLQYDSSAAPQTISLTGGLLKQADSLIKQMEMEARDAGDANLKAICKTYKKSLQSLKRDYEAAAEKANRSDLMGGAGAGGLGGDRGRMAQATDALGRQNETLENARRAMADTEDVALEITEELGRNREKIASARDKVGDVSGMTNQARRLVQSMSKRETQQKIMMYGFAFVLLGSIVLVVYYMGMGKSD
jgi:vesicle transport through interaction with t-SNAREs protein 1